MMDEQTTRDVIEHIIALYGNDPDQWPRELYPLAMGESISAEVLEKLMSTPSAPAQASTASGNACAHCSKPDAKKRCSACKSVVYCSVVCQRAAWPTHKRVCKKAAMPMQPPPLPPPPPRTGGEWDDVSEQQVMLALTEAERAKLKSVAPSRIATLRDALGDGVKSGLLKLYANAPRYDRLFVCTTTKDRATYVLEAGLDAWEGSCSWTTKDLTEANLRAQDLSALGVDGLQSEYGGVLDFFDTCKRLGAPRYTIRTDLDPDAKPHVIAVVERLLAASSLRFLLDDTALARVDGGEQTAASIS